MEPLNTLKRMYHFGSFYKCMIISLTPSFEVWRTHAGEEPQQHSVSQAPRASQPRVCLQSPGVVPESSEKQPLPAQNSVPRPWVELCANVLDDCGDQFVEVVKLVHKEGVVLGRVSGDDFQLVLCSPDDANCIGDHTCEDKISMKQMGPKKSTANGSLPSCCCAGYCVWM